MKPRVVSTRGTVLPQKGNCTLTHKDGHMFLYKQVEHEHWKPIYTGWVVHGSKPGGKPKPLEATGSLNVKKKTMTRYYSTSNKWKANQLIKHLGQIQQQVYVSTYIYIHIMYMLPPEKSTCLVFFVS